MRCVALPVPITAGIPYSRATIEPCARMPPMSVTNPRACANSGVQAGVVVGQTRIVPGSICPKSAGEWITLAGAVTRPGLTAKPCSVVASARLRRCVSRPERSIGPHRRPAVGGTAAGGCSRRCSSRKARRSRARRTRSGRASPAARAAIAFSSSSLSRKKTSSAVPSDPASASRCPSSRAKRRSSGQAAPR
ncbi:MAG: hypothetical protein K0Q89_2730 [Thermomicrobiales bacterium]|nr:hypothetical protein [Thermomicrobiales bacterium]